MSLSFRSITVSIREQSLGRTVLLLLCGFLFAFCEAIVAYMTSCVSLFADSLHLLHLSFAIFSKFLTIFVEKMDLHPRFSYGLQRIGVFTNFAGSVFVLIMSASLVIECAELFIAGLSSSLSVSIPFILILSVSVTLHILLSSPTTPLLRRLLPPFLLFMATSLHQDPSIALLMSIILASKSWPDISTNARILLQRTPEEIQTALNTCVKEAGALEGVLEVSEEHYWSIVVGKNVGCLTVRVRADAETQSILSEIHKIYSPYIDELTVQVEKSNWDLPEMTIEQQQKEEEVSNETKSG